MTMDEATLSLNQGDKKRAKLLFESVANQGCTSGCNALFQIGQIRKQEKDLKGAAEAYAKAAACDPNNKEYAEAAKRAKQEAALPPQASPTQPVAPPTTPTTPAATSPSAQTSPPTTQQSGPKGQVAQPITQTLPQSLPQVIHGKPTTAPGPQSLGSQTNQPVATATTPPTGQTMSKPVSQTVPPLPPAPATAPQPPAKGMTLAGKYSGSLSAPQLTSFAEVNLTVTPSAAGGGKVTGRVICENLEVGRLEGTVDTQGGVNLTVRGGKDYAEVTGTFTGKLDATIGQGKWRAADGKEKGEGTWSVKAK